MLLDGLIIVQCLLGYLPGVDHEGEFVVQAQRRMAEVVAADKGEAPVDNGQLGMGLFPDGVESDVNPFFPEFFQRIAVAFIQ